MQNWQCNRCSLAGWRSRRSHAVGVVERSQQWQRAVLRPAQLSGALHAIEAPLPLYNARSRRPWVWRVPRRLRMRSLRTQLPRRVRGGAAAYVFWLGGDSVALLRR